MRSYTALTIACRGEMNHTGLFRVRSTELGVAVSTTPEPSHVRRESDRASRHELVGAGTDRSNSDVVPTACREREPVTVDAVVAICCASSRRRRVILSTFNASYREAARDVGKAHVSGLEADEWSPASRMLPLPRNVPMCDVKFVRNSPCPCHNYNILTLSLQGRRVSAQMTAKRPPVAHAVALALVSDHVPCNSRFS